MAALNIFTVRQFVSSACRGFKFPVVVNTRSLLRRMCSSTSLGPKVYTRTGDQVLKDNNFNKIGFNMTVHVHDVAIIIIELCEESIGYTSTYGGERLPKTNAIFEALGATDELSSVIGVACEFCDEAGHEDIVTKLEEIQCILQDVGSNIATPRQSSPQRNIEKTKFDADATKVLEQWIDAYHNQLPPLRNFILPSGGKSAAMLHVARSICRRAERRVMPLVQSGSVEPEVGSFLNRLSDFLFTAGRFVSKMEGKTEKIYRRIQR